MKTSRKCAALGALAAACCWTAAIDAATVTPNQGQSATQQQTDDTACKQAATRQTGYDPANPPATAANYEATQGARARGAARGAAAGAAIGAIAGDAGQGAAIGAAAGGMRGGAQRRQARRADQAAQSESQNQKAAYDQAFAGCMGGKGYTVK